MPLKMHNTIVTNQSTLKHIRRITHNDKVAFILEMQGWFNIKKLINVITIVIK